VVLPCRFSLWGVRPKGCSYRPNPGSPNPGSQPWPGINRKTRGGAETKFQKLNSANIKQTPILKIGAPHSFLLSFLYLEFVCCLAFAIWGLVNEDNLSPEISLDPLTRDQTENPGRNLKGIPKDKHENPQSLCIGATFRCQATEH